MYVRRASAPHQLPPVVASRICDVCIMLYIRTQSLKLCWRRKKVLCADRNSFSWLGFSALLSSRIHTISPVPIFTEGAQIGLRVSVEQDI